MKHQLRYYAQVMQTFELMETWQRHNLDPSWINSLLLGEVDKFHNFMLQKLNYRYL